MQKALGSTSTSGSWLTKFVNNGPLSLVFRTGENSIAERINNPIKFVRNNAGGSQSTTNGYEATLLIDICSMIIDENRTGNFNDEKFHPKRKNLFQINVFISTLRQSTVPAHQAESPSCCSHRPE